MNLLIFSEGASDCPHESAEIEARPVSAYEDSNPFAAAYITRCKDCGLSAQSFSAWEMLGFLADKNIKLPEEARK